MLRFIMVDIYEFLLNYFFNLSNLFENKRQILKEEFENTKGEIRIRISKKNRQHNDQKKKYKGTNNDLQNIHINLKIE